MTLILTGITWHLAYRAGSDHATRAAQAASLQVASDQLDRVARLAEQSNKIAIEYAGRRDTVETRYREITREVPRVLDPATSAAYPWPVGAVRLHDAAVLGRRLQEVPDPAGRADGAASEVGAAQGTDVVLENYRRCDLAFERLEALQRWAGGLAK